MPSKSVAQRRAAGIALSAKRGKYPVSSLRGAAYNMYKNMSEDQIRDFAKTNEGGLPLKKVALSPDLAQRVADIYIDIAKKEKNVVLSKAFGLQDRQHRMYKHYKDKSFGLTGGAVARVARSANPLTKGSPAVRKSFREARKLLYTTPKKPRNKVMLPILLGTTIAAAALHSIYGGDARSKSKNVPLSAKTAMLLQCGRTKGWV